LCSTRGVDGPVKPGHDGVDESKPASVGIIPTIMANDLSTHAVMAVLDTAGPPTAIHAFAFERRSSHESQPMLTGISYG